MKKIRLNKLDLENFMGLYKFSLTPNGSNAEIRGDNGTGKTTIASAFAWLFFGEDIYGNSTQSFTIKTMDASENVIHGIDHSVEGEIEVDGETITLKRIYRENWTKKRGSATKTLTSHTTDYFVNQEPMKKKEYEAFIETIMPKDIFRLCASITAFESLHWTKKRDILLSLCTGGQIEADLYKAEKQKKILLQKRRDINGAIDNIPPRISELTNSIEAVATFDEAEIQKQVDKLNAQIESLKADSFALELKKERANIENAIFEILSKIKELREAERKKLLDIYRGAEEKEEAKRLDLEQLYKKEKSVAESLDVTNIALEGYRAEFKELSDTPLDVDKVCPTCKQPLPEDMVGEALEEAKSRLSKKIEKVHELGGSTYEMIGNLEKELEALRKKTEEEEAALAFFSNLTEEARRALKAYPDNHVLPPTESKKVEKLRKQNEEIEAKLSEGDFQQQITGLVAEKLSLEGQLAEIKGAERSKVRIKELKKEKRALDGQYEDIEREIFESEEKMLELAQKLEDEVNSKFSLAKFKMVEVQINEGINPVCITTVNGIPWGHGLNTGNEINAGLDIIMTLGNHYGLKAPIFVDNAESVTKLIDPGTQVIKLIKDETRPELTAN